MSRITEVIKDIIDLLEADANIQFLLLNILNETFENADRWDLISGSWSITENKEYCGSNAPAYSLVKDWTIKDFKATFKVKATGTSNSLHGLVFRWRNSSNYYFFGIHPDLDKVILMKKSGGTSYTIEEYEISIDKDVWYTLECHALGNRIRCLLNDDLVIDTTDNSFLLAGRIGFGINNTYASALFDDLQVSPIETKKDEYGGMPIYHGYIGHEIHFPCITVMDVTDQAEVSGLNDGYDGEKRYQWQYAIIQIDCWSVNGAEERDSLADAVLKCLLKNEVSSVIYVQEPLVLTLDEVTRKPHLWRKAIRFKVMYVLEVK